MKKTIKIFGFRIFFVIERRPIPKAKVIRVPGLRKEIREIINAARAK